MLRALESLRRYLLILTLGLWLGGFTFYALFVLPTAHDVLSDRFASGLVTRGVTQWLNRLGVAAVLLMLWDALLACRSRRRWLAVAMLAAWSVIACSHVALFVVHPRIDALIDIDGERILNSFEFRSLHTTYERISGIQWFMSLAFLWLSLLSWRHRDVGFIASSRDANASRSR